jgi:hypothetical protein
MKNFNKNFHLFRFKKISFFIIFLVSDICIANSQPVSRNTLYLEGASQGATYSFNYDRIFNIGKKMTKSYRVGLSLLNNTIALPLGLQFITGKGLHHLEYSLTVVPYFEKYRELFSGNNLSDEKVFIIPGVGYRYQSPGGGFFGKIVIGPLIYLDPPADYFWKMDTRIYPGITAGAGISF